MQINLDPAQTMFFRAAMACRATNDVRDYLHRLYFVDNEIVATNGHILFWTRHWGDAVPGGLLVNVDALKLPAKVARVDMDFSHDAVELAGYDKKDAPAMTATLPCETGKYANYQSVMSATLSKYDDVPPPVISAKQIQPVEKAIGARWTRIETVSASHIFRLHFGGGGDYLNEPEWYKCLVMGWRT